MRRVIAAKPASRAPARRRARVKPRVGKGRLKALGAVLAASVWGAAAWQVWESGWIQEGGDRAYQRLVELTASLGFTVREITVQGRVETGVPELRAALGLESGSPIFGFDAEGAHERVKKLPWVRAATVERQLPNVVRLRIVERKPIALWQRDGKFNLIDTEGAVIPIEDFERFAKLVVVVGAGAPPYAAPLIDLIAREPDLARRVRAAVWVGDRRWDLHLDDSVRVMLPEEDAGAAWRRLAEMQRTGALLARDFSVIDLRLKDRVVVRKAPDDEPMPDPRQRHT